jgi:6-phosphogluconolactonase (cycloisomerase 2 family)
VSFTPDGRTLIVTEKATNRLVVFAIDKKGLPGAPRIFLSKGDTPFGFGFGRRDQLFVSEAFGGAVDASALSSYLVSDQDQLEVISASVPTTETAACWVAVTPSGRFAYVTNTGSSSISGYAIGFDGELALLDADGVTATTGFGSSPIDLAMADGGRYLYALNAGTNTIGAFGVHPGSGALSELAFIGGLPAGANGLAVR